MSNYNTYIGDKKSLKFPVMCDGNVLISRSNNIAETDYGIWEHTGDFSMQFIITPYDINGSSTRTLLTTPTFPNGILDSQKTMPTVRQEVYIQNPSGEGDYQSEKYLPISNRFDWFGTGSKHKMMLFKSPNFELFLQNETNHNENQPAEYSIGCKMTISNSFTLNSPTIIRARDTNYTLNDDIKYLGSIQNIVDTTVVISVSSQNLITGELTFQSNNALENIHHKMEIYDVNGLFIGTVINVNQFLFTVDTSISNYTKAQYDATDGTIYKKPLQEAPYLESTYHIAVSYDDASGKIVIILNNTEIVSGIHTDRNSIDTNFNFGTGDIYLGKDASLTYPEDRKTQFMGEIHEMAITNSYLSSFSSLYSILPQSRQLLLYLTFEEED